MSRPAPLSEQLKSSASALSPQVGLVLLAAVALAAGSFFVATPVIQIALLSSAGTLTALVLLLRLIASQGRRVQLDAAQMAEQFSAAEEAPGFATDEDGRVLYRNAAAHSRFGSDGEQILTRALGEMFANPSAVIFRVQNRAQAQGAAQEDVVTRRGHVRISVHRFHERAFYWRFDEIEDRRDGRGAETLSLPVLTVGRNGTVLFMNEAARRVLGGRPKSLDHVFSGGPLKSGNVTTVMGEDGPISARVVEIAGRSGRREIYFFPVGGEEASGTLDDQFFDALPVALMKVARDGTIVMANRLARDLLPVARGEANFSDCVEGLGRSVLDWIEDVIEDRVANPAEVLRAVRDEGEVFLQITLERLIEDGEAGVVAVLHDATELKTLEAQFVQSQKMQAIGQLAGGVAHDFNNLLTAISGHCDLLLLRRDQGDPDYGDLIQIHQNANRAASLVGQLLAFSRKQTLRPAPLDVRDTMTDLTHLLNRLVGERVTLTLAHDPALSPIRADKRQLEQVIMNLVVNARDAMPDGGEIRIETTMYSLTEELRRDRAVVSPGPYVVIRVVDEGHGIPASKLHKIFEPFYTTKGTGKGTGLGLSTAYGIVKQSGGFIFVDSVVGSGTCFTLYFPAREAQAVAATQPPVDFDPMQDVLILEGTDQIPQDNDDKMLGNIFSELSDELSEHPDPVALSEDPPVDADTTHVSQDVAAELEGEISAPDDIPETTESAPPAQVTIPDAAVPSDGPRSGEGVVLLVEDEAPVRAFASRALRMRGFTVLEAGNAEEALQALSDSDINVDVFVTDVVMPGMDGPTWVRQALVDHPDTRVVFVSGYAEDSFADTQARIPNSVFLPKPFSLTELTTTVHEQMH